MDDILQSIVAFCAEHGLSETKFGELALNDKPFVSQLRDGRDVRQSTIRRVHAFMAEYVAPESAAA